MPKLTRTSVGPGWVYVLKTDSLPGCVKIGGTARTATVRAGELGREYGTATSFKIARRHAVADWYAVEQAAHRMLADRRRPSSELFEVTPSEASRVIRAVALAYQNYQKPWAPMVWLRRLMMPAPATPPRQAWRRHRHGSTDLWMWMLVFGLFALLAWLKPAAPTWLPPGAARALYTIEQLRP